MLARKNVEIRGGERYGKAFYRAEISLNFPTTCYSRRSEEGERERSRVNENLCGGTKRASRPRMHVRATNADRKSIKRLLHPRHSAAELLLMGTSLFLLSLSLRSPRSFLPIPLSPSFSCASRSSCHDIPRRCTVACQPPSSRHTRFLSSGPVNLKTILRRCTLLSKGVSFSRKKMSLSLSVHTEQRVSSLVILALIRFSRRRSARSRVPFSTSFVETRVFADYHSDNRYFARRIAIGGRRQIFKTRDYLVGSRRLRFVVCTVERWTHANNASFKGHRKRRRWKSRRSSTVS